MRLKIHFAAFAFLLTACSETKKEIPNQATYSIDGKKAAVYTTADSTDYRLSSTGILEFKEKGQPFENEVSVFVDPSKTFQTYR